jgi:hypothetical protein
MSLLREIQSAAIDSSVPVATLLRKCKVLAARLGNEEFKAWIDNELNGYKSVEELPEYRIFHIRSQGHFSGLLGSELHNADIPMICMPEELRKSLSHTYFLSPVAALEDLAVRNDGGNLAEVWDADIVARFGGNIYEDMNCMRAWKVIPASTVIAAIDTIRTRVLNFALEIEAEAPEAGEAQPNSNPVPQERIEQIFNTNIYGNVQNLANASPDAQQHATYNEQNAELFRDLLLAVENSGATPEVVTLTTKSIDAMGSATSPQSFQSAYLKFMSIVADHMQVLGGAVAPFLPAIAAMLGEAV